jgi:hypothetical protein
MDKFLARQIKIAISHEHDYTAESSKKKLHGGKQLPGVIDQGVKGSQATSRAPCCCDASPYRW